jgi:hypothetical protein
LHRLREEAGKPELQVTAAVWELDERLLARCAELGVYCCAVVAPTQDMAALQAFLDRYLQVADRVCR